MSRLRALLITDPLVILATIFYGLASLFASFFDRSGNRQARIARAWARMLLRIGGVRVAIEGMERLSRDGSYVFAANHLSYMDTPVVLASIPVQFRFLAKKGLFQIPFLGWHLARAGHIPVPRGDARGAVKAMTTAAETIREHGVSVLLFPEGGRSHDGVMRDFLEGAALIAIKAGVPIVPVALNGTREILPFGSGHIRAGAVRMRVGDPIPTGGLTLKDRGRLMQEARSRIVEMLEIQPVGSSA
ncbi:MAG: lysophospholipid acyltransferase family protein [Bryobacteraceae bacterium]